MGRRQARFFHRWVHRENDETFPSAYSLTTLGGPEPVGEDLLVFMTGSTQHLLSLALFCGFWTYAQTVCLIFEKFEVAGRDAVERDVIEPGLVAIGSVEIASAFSHASEVGDDAI